MIVEKYRGVHYTMQLLLKDTFSYTVSKKLLLCLSFYLRQTLVCFTKGILWIIKNKQAILSKLYGYGAWFSHGEISTSFACEHRTKANGNKIFFWELTLRRPGFSNALVVYMLYYFVDFLAEFLWTYISKYTTGYIRLLQINVAYLLWINKYMKYTTTNIKQ